MIVRSARPESHFTVFSNAIIRDTRLSYKARGILLDLLSRPDNWRISAEGLAEMGIDGRDAIMSGLKELRDLGYIVTQRSQNEKGLWTTESVVYDQPKAGFPSSDKPNSDNPVVIEEPKKKNYKEKGDLSPQMQLRDLVQIYFDNFMGDLAPARAPLVGQLQLALKEIPYKKLEPLVIAVAKDGQVISRNTLVYAQSRLKPVQATPTPPKFDPSEYERPDAKPMSAEVREAILKGLGKSVTDEEPLDALDEPSEPIYSSLPQGAKEIPSERIQEA